MSEINYDDECVWVEKVFIISNNSTIPYFLFFLIVLLEIIKIKCVNTVFSYSVTVFLSLMAGQFSRSHTAQAAWKRIYSFLALLLVFEGNE